MFIVMIFQNIKFNKFNKVIFYRKRTAVQERLIETLFPFKLKFNLFESKTNK